MSTADEIAKLDALRRSGALTDAEFEAQKARLLAGTYDREPPGESAPGGLGVKGMDVSWLVLLGAAVLIIAAFLPWFTASAAFVSVSRNAFQLGQDEGFSIDGLVMVAAGIVAGLVAIAHLRHTTLRVKWSAIVAGLVAAIWAGFDVANINQSLVDPVKAKGGVASVGFGVWLAVIGGVVTALAAIAMRREMTAQELAGAQSPGQGGEPQLGSSGFGSTQPPPGWYPDQSSVMRWWDGSQWREEDDDAPEIEEVEGGEEYWTVEELTAMSLSEVRAVAKEHDRKTTGKSKDELIDEIVDLEE
jgi:hypothetical protein